jgi:hypothetical protein
MFLTVELRSGLTSARFIRPNKGSARFPGAIESIPHFLAASPPQHCLLADGLNHSTKVGIPHDNIMPPFAREANRPWRHNQIVRVLPFIGNRHNRAAVAPRFGRIRGEQKIAQMLLVRPKIETLKARNRGGGETPQERHEKQFHRCVINAPDLEMRPHLSQTRGIPP